MRRRYKCRCDFCPTASMGKADVQYLTLDDTRSSSGKLMLTLKFAKGYLMNRRQARAIGKALLRWGEGE